MPKALKILIFTTQFYLLSGAERLAVELAEEMNKHGIHADILSMYTEDLPGVAEKKNELLRKGIPTVHFLGMKIHPSVTNLFPAIQKLRCLIRENGYDLVESSQILPNVIASWACKWKRTSHIAGLHYVLRRDNRNNKQHILCRFTMWCNKHTRFYAVSDYVADTWIRYSSISPKHIIRIYNGIPDDCYKVSTDKTGIFHELTLSKEQRIVLFVGRIDTYKGIDTLFNALRSVVEKENLVLLYVGHEDLTVQGTNEMLRSIKQATADTGLSNRVRFIGRREDIPRLMAASDILVHPARTEGFGLVLAEAMAAGLQVVASNIEGIPEVLRKTDSLMVPPDDPIALCEAVLKTLNRTPVESSQAIEKGRKRAESFRMSERIKQMIKLFKVVLSNQS